MTSETPFCLKSIFLSKRGGQREDEGKIFSIPLASLPPLPWPQVLRPRPFIS
jgi:hypothetical protein